MVVQCAQHNVRCEMDGKIGDMVGESVEGGHSLLCLANHRPPIRVSLTDLVRLKGMPEMPLNLSTKGPRLPVNSLAPSVTRNECEDLKHISLKIDPSCAKAFPGSLK